MLVFNSVAVLTAIILFSIECAADSERIRLDAKKLINGKVLASGVSIPAKSLSNCLNTCNLRKKSCDGIVYHEIIQKCRLINKCAPAYLVGNSSSIVYYSKRPQITVPGYVYDGQSDSCLGLIKINGNYAQADGYCRKQNAHLAVIEWKKLNQVASSLISKAGIKWAWISDENVAHEGPIKPHGVSGNEVLPKEVFSPEVVQRRNTSYRSCWGLNDRGQWGQYSCKNKTMMALCQVHQFA